MNPAREALDLLRQRVTIADVDSLGNSERRQLASICQHWASLIRPSADQANSCSEIAVIRYNRGERARVKQIIRDCEQLNEKGLNFVHHVSLALAGEFPRLKLEAHGANGHRYVMKQIMQLAELLNEEGLDRMSENIQKAVTDYGDFLSKRPASAKVVSLVLAENYSGA